MSVPYSSMPLSLRCPRRARVLAVWGLVAFGCPLLAGQTIPADADHTAGFARTVPAAPAPPALALPEYVIGADDLLTIQVFDDPDISGDYRVSPDGLITLPLLSQAVVAAGLTPVQLSARIGETYRKVEILDHPRVIVTVKEPRLHSITIAGAVKHPQVYPLLGTTTLSDALSQAEGLADDASTTATVTRGEIALLALKQSAGCAATPPPAACGPSFTVDLKQLLEGGDPSLNATMYPGDRVTVLHAGIVYVIGAVNRPGGFPLKTGQDDMTVIWALALAQDFTPTASKTKAMIIRKDSAVPSGRQEIRVNLKQVLAGKGDDTRLMANDILYVMDSTEKRALHRAADAAVQAATWGVIYHY